MKRDRYLLLAYKNDSDSYSMGCHMESYSSDFKGLHTDDREKVIRKIAELQTEVLGHQEDGYTFELIIDGICDFHQLEIDTDIAPDYEDDDFVEYYNERDEIFYEAATIHAQVIEAREAKKKAERKRYEEKEKKTQELNDLKEFERLKAKLGK